MNSIVFGEINKSILVNFSDSIFNYFHAMIDNEEVADLFLTSCIPKQVDAGSKYALTPLGALFNLSMLPKVPMGKHEYFLKPMDQVSTSYFYTQTKEQWKDGIYKLPESWEAYSE